MSLIELTQRLAKEPPQKPQKNGFNKSALIKRASVERKPKGHTK
jgi:hypothetical protein